MRRFILGMLVMLAAVWSGQMILPPAASQTATACIDTEEAAFLGLINDYRTANGIAPVVLLGSISNAADFHSVDMATYAYFSHTLAGPDHVLNTGDDYTWSWNMTNFGYPTGGWRGENLALNYETATQVFAGWQGSVSHNATMLDPAAKYIGIGRAFGWGTMWTTDFGDKNDGTAPSFCDGVPAPTATPTRTPAPTVTPGPPTPTSTPKPCRNNKSKGCR